MGSKGHTTEIQGIQKQLDELKRIIKDGLQTPHVKVDPEKLKLVSTTTTIKIKDYNTLKSDEYTLLKEKVESLQKQVQKLEYQLVHVLRACSEKDSLIAQKNI